MKKIWKYSLLMAGVLAAAVAAHQLAQDPSYGVFYHVTGGKNDLYLLGSIHVGSREMYPMSNAILEAIRQADVMVFECDTTSPEIANATAQMMRSDTPLSAVLSAQAREKLEKAAERLKYDLASLEYLKPWAVTSRLTVATAAREMESGGSRSASALGVEEMVRRQADGKTVAYLETAVGQLETMEAFSPALQEYLLVSACQAVLDPENGSGTDQDVDQWPKWWKDGNAQAFADSYRLGLTRETSPELAQEYHHALMTERNIQMARKMQAMLENDEPHSYFVTVGLMHLVLPEDSILTELQKLGYTVEQVFQ